MNLCCQTEVSAMVRSLVQRSPTECGVSECDLETSKMRKHRPHCGCRAMKKEKSIHLARHRCSCKPRLSYKFPGTFVWEGSLPCSQESTTISYSKPAEYSPHLTSVLDITFQARSQNCLQRLLASSRLSVRPHEPTRLPLDGFS